jgi:hypothetical protein
MAINHQTAKKRVDPNKPRKRRTQSAYMLWMNQEGRQNAKKRYPDMKVTAVASLCGEIWRGMSPAMKKPWEQQAEALKSQEVDRYSESVATAPARKKRPPSAYMLWMNKTGRELAKSQYPDLKVTQIASLCGRYWREMEDAEKVRGRLLPVVVVVRGCVHACSPSSKNKLMFLARAFFLAVAATWPGSELTRRIWCARCAVCVDRNTGKTRRTSSRPSTMVMSEPCGPDCPRCGCGVSSEAMQAAGASWRLVSDALYFPHHV